ARSAEYRWPLPGYSACPWMMWDASSRKFYHFACQPAKCSLLLNHRSPVEGLEPPRKAHPGSQYQFLGTVTTPQGRSPALTFRMMVPDAASTMETSFDGPLAVKSSFSSGDRVIPHGRWTTSKHAAIALDAVSNTNTFLLRPVLTYNLDPALLITSPMGFTPSPSRTGLNSSCRMDSITLT